MNDIDLTFKDFEEKLKTTLGKSEWVTVFFNSDYSNEFERGGYYSALISNDKVEQVLNDYSWDLCKGDHGPGFSCHFENGKEIFEYYRICDEGIEPLVLWRDFFGLKPDYLEISEEFRLYHNLFEDKTNSVFIKIDENGDDEEVAIVTKNEVKIKLKYIKEFLAAKKMHLAIYFDFMRFSKKSLNDLGIKPIDKKFRGDKLCYSILVRKLILTKTNNQGWILGKKLITPADKVNTGIFNSRANRIYEEFIIDLDDNGEPIYHTCNEENLSNYFGKNPGAPHYLTPVFLKDQF